MTSKRCHKCGVTKPVSEFHKRRMSKDGLSYICIECNKKKVKEYYQLDKVNHKKRVKANKERTIILNRSLMLKYLASHPCIDCGETDIRVLEFDHVRGKTHNIANMMYDYTWSSILEEIAKCEVRCANDHKRRTYVDSYRDLDLSPNG